MTYTTKVMKKCQCSLTQWLCLSPKQRNSKSLQIGENSEVNFSIYFGLCLILNCWLNRVLLLVFLSTSLVWISMQWKPVIHKASLMLVECIISEPVYIMYHLTTVSVVTWFSHFLCTSLSNYFFNSVLKSSYDRDVRKKKTHAHQ